MALVINTGFRRRTIFVASTAQNAQSVHASLVRLTLRVSDARDHALVVYAFFAIGTIGGRSTNSCNLISLSAKPVASDILTFNVKTCRTYTLSFQTHALLAISVDVAIIRSANAAILWALRGWDKFMDALASGLTVNDVTNGIRTTGIFTGIGTPMIVTDGVHWAILGSGTVTLRLATFQVRIPDEI